ncbi:MAG: ATP synthase F0 subunit A [Acidobacteria bacterium RIFCSPLOWO2_02_FULL_67_36]|nr:MAG: ATP synthase F0 subunit A [Acidobacteria bacterium RIFCSPLOWO2_02_FULL_67_36]OFW19110.1 MAG: ATP synthase F0 subunit A [Acidobacteria bacterium RIFCSPLOWO2_12_FULL_66_21]
MKEHPLLIVEAVNAVLGPLVAAALGPLGFHVEGHEVIPPYLVMVLLIVAGLTVLSLVVRSRLSVDNPGRLQILMEDAVRAVLGLLEEWIGPGGARFLPLVATLGLFILTGNYMGLVPGLMSPTSSINVTLGCALTIWVYYHFQGIKTQGVVAYVKHFAVPPGAPVFIAPIMLPIEIISHLSRVLSLSLRLFGNIFGEEMVIVILFSIIPFLVPLPMMFLGLVTGGLQAFIFVLLSIIYLQGAVAVEHHVDEHGHDAPSGHEAPAAA